jgi:dihydrofolate synthase/folylpolyglutamate synthase
MTFEDALAYLLSLGHETLTIKLGLTNTETLLAALGSPHKQFPAVQIAGTNGKGSTAETLACICRAAGIRTGLFTSPHLVSITERIQINGEPISESDFACLTARVKETAELLLKQGQLQTIPTFFEQVTAIALLAFREAKIELAVLETGLGGRLDSTTAAGAEVVALTPIAMDHEEYLGHSLSEIAAEKAAIIRPGVTVIIGPQSAAALDVIAGRCERLGVEPRFVNKPEMSELDALPARYRERFCIISSEIAGISEEGRFCVTFKTGQASYQNIRLGLRGRHQIANVAIAIGLAEALRERGFAISRAAIVKGIENVRHPGRLEMWAGRPPILFDGAHNPAAARALRDHLDEFVKRPVTMMFGAMRDKALAEMTAVLFPAAETLILTEFDNPRAATLDMLKLAVPDGLDQSKVKYASSVGDALRMVKQMTSPNALLCVTGSLYLIGAAQQALHEEHDNSAVLFQPQCH